MSRKKILFCDNSLKEFINFRYDVVCDYLKRDFDVVIVAPLNRDIPLYHEHLKYVPISLNRSGMNPIMDFVYFIKLYQIYRKERPDYIFHYTIKPNIYGSIAAKLCKVHSTAMIAGLGYVFNRSGVRCRIAIFLYKFALKFVDHVLVLNRSNYDLLLNMKIVTAKQLILLKGGEGVNLVHFK